MKYFKPIVWLGFMFALLIPIQTDASLVKQFNLGEMTNNADKIFRGTVINIENGKLAVGGGELPTITYTIRVSDTLKGDTSSANEKAGNVVQLKMLGSIKVPSQNGMKFAGGFKTPTLKNGQEYLLFTTQPSSLGLSMTVGVDQGLFRFVYGNRVINDVKNNGLFRNMDSDGMPQQGAVPYADMANRIRTLTN